MSKVLELLKRLSKNSNFYDDNYKDYQIIEKELKALEIIKKKKVDVKYLCYRAEFNVDKYNDNYVETLTKKECKLLKEVLEND